MALGYLIYKPEYSSPSFYITKCKMQIIGKTNKKLYGLSADDKKD